MGLFVTLEGIDGSGKSTQGKLLAESLSKLGHDVTLTREPGGSDGAEEIRRLLVEGKPDRWSPETEILLFTAARRDHVESKIRPALDRGGIVICDRYVDSTRAYQGGDGRRKDVDALHDLMIGLDADLTLIFDLDPGVALERAESRATIEDRFERKGADVQRRLRETFLGIARSEPARCRIVPASHKQAEIAEHVLAIVGDRLEAANG